MSVQRPHQFEDIDKILLGPAESVDRMICSGCHRLLWVDDEGQCELKMVDGWFHPYIHVQYTRRPDEVLPSTQLLTRYDTKRK